MLQRILDAGIGIAERGDPHPDRGRKGAFDGDERRHRCGSRVNDFDDHFAALLVEPAERKKLLDA